MLKNEIVFADSIRMLDLEVPNDMVARNADLSSVDFSIAFTIEPNSRFGECYASISVALERLNTVTDGFKQSYHWACRFILPEARLCPEEVECIDLYKLAGIIGVTKCS